MSVVIRADGGPQIGYGHLIRSGALADELQSHGHTIIVATTTPQPATAVFPDRITTVELPSRDNPKSFVNWLETTPIAAVFTDAYPVDTAHQQEIRTLAQLIS